LASDFLAAILKQMDRSAASGSHDWLDIMEENTGLKK